MKKILFIFFILSFLSFANPNSAGPVEIIVTANVDNTNSTQLYIVEADSERPLIKIPITHDGVNSSNANTHSATGTFRVMRGRGVKQSVNFPAGYKLQFNISPLTSELKKDPDSAILTSKLSSIAEITPPTSYHITDVINITSTLSYTENPSKPLNNGSYTNSDNIPTLTVTLNKTGSTPQP